LFFFLVFRFSNSIKSVDTEINLEFIVPASDQVIVATLSSKHNKDVSFYKIIRSVLYINNIVMDCSFTFNRDNHLQCDINNACISHLDSNQVGPIKIHFENLGIGDITIIEIKQKDSKTNYQTSLFYDGLLCIGDSRNCGGHRYIDFITNQNTKMLEMSPINSQIHNKLQCNSKNTKYHEIQINKSLKQREIEIEREENDYGSYGDEKKQQEQILGSKRQILSINYNHYNYKNNGNYYHHKYYMDILLTIVLLAMIVISVYNMSYAFNHFKGNDNTLRYQYYDTRRV